MFVRFLHYINQIHNACKVIFITLSILDQCFHSSSKFLLNFFKKVPLQLAYLKSLIILLGWKDGVKCKR